MQNSLLNCGTPKFNFYETLSNIANGTISDNLDELTFTCNHITKITDCAKQTNSVIIATVHAKMEKENSLHLFKEWCYNNSNAKDESHLSHLIACGNMLIGLLNCGMQHYKRIFKLPHNKQYPLTSIYSKKGLGVTALINFINKYPLEQLKREKIRAYRDRYLAELSGKVITDEEIQPKQLTFQFDLFDELDNVKMATIMEAEDFNEMSALTMLDNAETINNNLIPYIVNRPEFFEGEDSLQGLQNLYNSLSNSSNQILKLIQAKQRENILGE